jgi:hypothetical protein
MKLCRSNDGEMTGQMRRRESAEHNSSFVLLVGLLATIVLIYILATLL